MLPQPQQQYGRTSNLVERAFVAARRRTKVIPPFWEEGRGVMVVSGVLIRVRERWRKKCFSEFDQPQMRSLREQLKLDEQEVRTGELSLPGHTRRSAASAA